MTGPAYAVSEFRDPAAEVARLAEQARVIAEREEQLLCSLGFPERGRALDLGCGPGFVAARLIERRPALQLIGIDRDPELIARATRQIVALVADANALPFGADCFECVHARLVLRHLSDPEGTIREIWRVLSPGGRLIVIDSDEFELQLDPQPAGFARALEARLATYRRRGADPGLVRRLPALLEAAKFSTIVSQPLPLDSTQIGVPAFMRLVLAPIADAIDADLLRPEDLIEVRSALECWAARPDARGRTVAHAVAANKPLELNTTRAQGGGSVPQMSVPRR